MAGTSTPIFPQTIQSPSVDIVNATGTGTVTVYTAGANGSKIENILVTNTDTNAYSLQLSVMTSATTYLLGTVNIPASSGNTTAAASISLTQAGVIPLPRDSNGNPYIYLANGSVLKANTLTTVTSAKTVAITAFGGDY